MGEYSIAVITGNTRSLDYSSNLPLCPKVQAFCLFIYMSNGLNLGWGGTYRGLYRVLVGTY